MSEENDSLFNGNSLPQCASKIFRKMLNPDTDNGSDQDRLTPDSRCTICLGRYRNKSFTNSCLHEFCFECLKKWAKVKAECPLCKQPIESIIHNVRSNDEYDQYSIPRPRPEPIVFPSRGIGYSLMFNFNSRTLEVSHLPFQNDYNNRDQLPSYENHPVGYNLVRNLYRFRWGRTRHRIDFRTAIYEQNRWVLPLADVTGRFRESSPQFYSRHPDQIDRILPWLRREANVLFPNSDRQANELVSRVVISLRLLRIDSNQFRARILPLLGDRTEHFLHELRTFAHSVYDMVGFDTFAQYPDVPRPTFNYSSSTEIDLTSNLCDQDSDIRIINIPSNSAASSSTLAETIVISDSNDSDDSQHSHDSNDSDIIEVPRQQLDPPEVVILSSDEEPQPSTSQGVFRNPGFYVKRRYSTSSSEDSTKYRPNGSTYNNSSFESSDSDSSQETRRTKKPRSSKSKKRSRRKSSCDRASNRKYRARDKKKRVDEKSSDSDSSDSNQILARLCTNKKT